MRVAFCTHYPISAVFGDDLSAPPPGEHPFSWVRLLARALVDGGHVSSLDILTHTARYPRDEVVERDGITFRLFAWRDRIELPPLRLRGYRVAWGRALFRLAGCLRALSPDVVHAHGTDDVYGPAALLGGRPHLLSLQGIMADIARVQPSPRTLSLQRLERLTLRRATAVNAKTPVAAAFARSLNRRAEVFQIEDPVSPRFFEAPVPPARRVLHFVGELLPRKGIEPWIRAFAILAARYPDLRGIVAGGGPSWYLEQLRRILRETGIDSRVRLAGTLSAAAVATGLAAGGVFCLPSFAEHCPNAVMEAMAAGLPVVASRVGDLHNLVEAEGSGLLVGAPDPLLIAEAVSRLLDAPSWHEGLGRRGREIALGRWRAERCAAEHARLYAHLASTSRARRRDRDPPPFERGRGP